MTRFRLLAISISWMALTPPLMCAGDLSRYRNFRIGSDLPAIAAQTQTNAAQVRVVHRRPALIQEIEWRPQPLGPSTEAEAANEVIFSFYNGQLYRILVNYDRYKTEGLTAEDLIEAISAVHGTAMMAGAGIGQPLAADTTAAAGSSLPFVYATRVAAEISQPFVADTTAPAEISLPSILGDSEIAVVLARWEDAENAFSLVRFSGQPTFALVALSKRLDALARAAVVEAFRLDALEAPQREIELQKKQKEEQRLQQEKARLANKVSFRP